MSTPATQSDSEKTRSILGADALIALVRLLARQAAAELLALPGEPDAATTDLNKADQK